MSTYIQGIFILACINIIAVLGLSLLTGFTGLFCFGQAGFLAIGAYISALITIKFNMPFIISLLAGMTVAGFVSILLGYPTLKLKGDYFAIATLGFSEAIRLIIENLDKITGGARGMPGIPTRTTLLLVIPIALISYICIRFYVVSKHGYNCIAIRGDEIAAESIGINSFHYKQISFFINGLLAGLAGGLLAHYVGFVQPSMFGIIKSTELVVMVIFGGMHSVTGATFAAVILTALPELLRAASAWRLVLYGALVVLIMIVRPKGLLGYWELNFKSLRIFWLYSRAGCIKKR